MPTWFPKCNNNMQFDELFLTYLNWPPPILTTPIQCTAIVSSPHHKIEIVRLNHRSCQAWLDAHCTANKWSLLLTADKIKFDNIFSKFMRFVKAEFSMNLYRLPIVALNSNQISVNQQNADCWKAIDAKAVCFTYMTFDQQSLYIWTDKKFSLHLLFPMCKILFLQSHSLRLSVCELRGDLDVTGDPFWRPAHIRPTRPSWLKLWPNLLLALLYSGTMSVVSISLNTHIH